MITLPTKYTEVARLAADHFPEAQRAAVVPHLADLAWEHIAVAALTQLQGLDQVVPKTPNSVVCRIVVATLAVRKEDALNWALMEMGLNGSHRTAAKEWNSATKGFDEALIPQVTTLLANHLRDHAIPEAREQ